MAWAALLPLAFSAVKTAIDSQNSTSADAAQDRAGAEKLRLMREGAGQMSQYRQQLTPQMLQAMQNQMGAYGGARSVLSQMYGGGGSGPPPAGQRPPNPSTAIYGTPGMQPIDGRPVGGFSVSGPPRAGTAPPDPRSMVYGGAGMGPVSGRGIVPPSVLRSMSTEEAGSRPALLGRGGVYQPETLRRMGFGGEQEPVRGRI